MPDLWMDVDAALSEVPVNMMPLIDDTDFKAIEAAIAYNAGGLALYWHFVTTAGAYTVTAVTPTTGGDYDWTDQGDAGIYTIEIPASGGASINNDTEGFGWFTGVATGVLPWRGPTIGFRAAGLNNVLIDDAYSTTRGLSGTALPAAAADAAGGLIISDAGGLDADTKLANTNEVTAARMGALTDLIDGGRLDLLIDAIKTKTDNLPANTSTVLGTPAGASLAADIVAVKAETATIVADTNELQTDWANGGRLDLILDAAGAAGDPWSTALPGAYGAGTAGLLVGTTIPNAITAIDDYVDSEVAAVLAAVDTEVAAIKTVTDAIGATGTGLSAVPWNSAWDAEVQSECTDALNAYDPPTNAEMEARTLVAGSYFDPAADTVAHVTLVDTTTTNTDMVADAPSAAAIRAEIDSNSTQLAAILEDTGTTLPASIAALLDSGVKKNTELAGFPFFMADTTDHVSGKTGLTVTATRSIDGAAFAACANAVSEVSNGWYKITLAAADLNGDIIALRFTGTGADDTGFIIKTSA